MFGDPLRFIEAGTVAAIPSAPNVNQNPCPLDALSSPSIPGADRLGFGTGH